MPGYFVVCIPVPKLRTKPVARMVRKMKRLTLPVTKLVLSRKVKLQIRALQSNLNQVNAEKKVAIAILSTGRWPENSVPLTPDEMRTFKLAHSKRLKKSIALTKAIEVNEVRLQRIQNLGEKKK